MHLFFMISISRSNESRVIDIGICEEFLEVYGIFVTESFCRAIMSEISTLLNLQAMFISAYREETCSIAQLIEAMDGIAVDRCVEVTDVRLSIDIEDGRHHIRSSRAKCPSLHHLHLWLLTTKYGSASQHDNNLLKLNYSREKIIS